MLSLYCYCYPIWIKLAKKKLWKQTNLIKALLILVTVSAKREQLFTCTKNKIVKRTKAYHHFSRKKKPSYGRSPTVSSLPISLPYTAAEWNSDKIWPFLRLCGFVTFPSCSCIFLPAAHSVLKITPRNCKFLSMLTYKPKTRGHYVVGMTMALK